MSGSFNVPTWQPYSSCFQFQSSTPDSDIFQRMLQAKLYYEDNKCNVYILQTVNTTNKMEMLREKHKSIKRK